MDVFYDNIRKYNYQDYIIFWKNLDTIRKSKIRKLIQVDDQKRSILMWYQFYQILKKRYDYSDFSIFYNAYGKPMMKNLSFSFSHSYDYVAIAISNKNIGIDIEKIRPVSFSVLNIFCTEYEKKYILNSNHPMVSLFDVFCLKEAYFKMLGTDLSCLKQVEFHITNDSVLCKNHPHLSITLHHKIEGYVVAIIESI